MCVIVEITVVYFSLRLFIMAQRTTAQLLWFPLVPGGSTRILTPVSPSAEVLCLVDAGRSQQDVG